MMKGKALRRALASVDATRVNADVPLITSTTELITPTTAHAMLKHNTRNRPINWQKVEEYADLMRQGEWLLHGQGIELDGDGNILTGQKRLWAVIYSGTNVYMRVSRGSAQEVARVLDRGTPQSARDLAARDTGRKHSPTEASIARAYSALMGNTRPSVDALALVLAAESDRLAAILDETSGTKKTRPVLMVLGAVLAENIPIDRARALARRVDRLAAALEDALAPQTAAQCWGRGAAFGLAMDVARRVVQQEPS